MKSQLKLFAFQSFMSSPAGRWTRVLLGLAMISKGLQANGRKGPALASLGLLPLAAGTFDICLLSPFLGGHLSGDATRAALHSQSGYPQLGSRAQTWFQA